jgi:hypothetical protein
MWTRTVKLILSSLAAAATMSAALSATSAQAAHYVFNLTGDTSNLTTSSFNSGGSLYETGELALEGFTPITLVDGDTFEATVTITGANLPPFPQFILPLRDEMFFGFNFADVLGGAQPTDAQANGEFRFDGGGPVGSGCGNCTSFIIGMNNTPFGFDSFTATGTFTLGAPYEVNFASISYQVRDYPVAVPEPGVWALMILGFGAAGATIRARRHSNPVAAA